MSNEISATRVVVSTLAGIIAAAGVMHGYFEVRQGGAPDGLVVNAIGPQQRLWEYAGLHAFTVIPSFVVSGIAAITVGAVAIVWAVRYIHTRSGPRVMLGLFLLLFLSGGGFGPIGVGIPVSLVATRIGKPLTWRRHLPPRARRVVAATWPWTLVVYVALFLASVATTISGKPLTLLTGEETAQAIVLEAGYVLLAVMVVSIISAFAHDLHHRIDVPTAGLNEPVHIPADLSAPGGG